MQQLSIKVIVCIFLLLSSWIDIRKREVSLKVLGLFAAIGVLVYGWSRHISPEVMICGVGMGLVLMVISKMTKGQIGMGDGMLLCVTGIYVGFYRNLEMFFGALLLAGVYSIFLLVTKRGKRKTEIPFVPFLFIAYVSSLVITGI